MRRGSALQRTVVAWCIAPSFSTTPFTTPPSTTMCPTLASVSTIAPARIASSAIVRDTVPIPP